MFGRTVIDKMNPHYDIEILYLDHFFFNMTNRYGKKN